MSDGMIDSNRPRLRMGRPRTGAFEAAERVVAGGGGRQKAVAHAAAVHQRQSGGGQRRAGPLHAATADAIGGGLRCVDFHPPRCRCRCLAAANHIIGRRQADAA